MQNEMQHILEESALTIPTLQMTPRLSQLKSEHASLAPFLAVARIQRDQPRLGALRRALLRAAQRRQVRQAEQGHAQPHLAGRLPPRYSGHAVGGV